jgi:hypothetical protein
MTIAIIYALVVLGVEEVTGKFWKSALWPYHVGMVIGQAINARNGDLKS